MSKTEPSSSPASQILERAVILPGRSAPRGRRFALLAGSLGALGVAATLGLALAGRASAPLVHVQIDLPGSSAAALTGPVRSPAAVARSAVDGRIQVALLLDTSSSMGGLIDQARSQLWKIVTRLDAAHRGDKRPVIEIALYEYGNQRRATAASGWIRQITPFTTDLDRVSEALFALSVDGGEEYVGQAISTAIHDLAWSGSEGDLRLLFIAGNESFDQGPVAPERAMASAWAKGVSATAILCGTDDPSWRIGSEQSRMGYFAIDPDQIVAHVAAPQDAEITRLGEAMNATYIPFGATGLAGSARQVAQDGNAARSQPGSQVWRSIAKSSANYDNWSWDLVDGDRSGNVVLGQLSEHDLPPVMRGMTSEQRQAYVDQKRAERTKIQQRIQELGQDRARFLAAAPSDSDRRAESLDSAMLRALSAQARAVQFQLD